MVPAGETLRTRPGSAMNKLPAPSTATPVGQISCVLVAGPSYGESYKKVLGPQHCPLPATVEMLPPGETLRIQLQLSAMHRLPAPSTATPVGFKSVTAERSATVLMIPPEETLRMRPWSAMNRVPAPSTATPAGLKTCALVAGPPSPE